MGYTHQDYPKVLYHATEAPQTVATDADRRALGAGWHETPAPAGEPEPASKAKPAKPAKVPPA